MKDQSIVCYICGSTKIKETRRNKYGRELIYYSNFGRRKYCSKDCFFIGVRKRQMSVGVFTMIFSLIAGGFLIYLNLWDESLGGSILAISIMVSLVGIALGAYVFYTGIKGKRLKEEREFKSIDVSNP